MSTLDVNISPEETVLVCALKLNANVILTLTSVKRVPQSHFLEKHSNYIYFTSL